MNMTPKKKEALNNELDDWRQLQQDWQSYQPDIVKIKKRIEWVTWRMVAILSLDVLFLVLYIPFLMLKAMQDTTSLAGQIWIYGMIPLFVYGVYWDFKLRLPLFKLENESTKGILSFYLKRIKVGVQLGDIGYKFGILLLFLFCSWVGSNWYFDLGEEKIKKVSFILFGIVFISSSIGIMLWYKLKKQKELSHLTELWKEFLE